jgi:hypothetical protein
MNRFALTAVNNGRDALGGNTEAEATYKPLPQNPAKIQSSLDAGLTRIAVEFTLPETHRNEIIMEPLLNSLREMLSLDLIFVAIFDESRSRVMSVASAIATSIKNCKPQDLVGAMQPCSINMLKRLLKHQLLDVRDLNTLGPEHELLSSQVASVNMSSALVAGLKIGNNIQGLMYFASFRRRSSWEVETHLILKLMSASFAAGYERLQLQPIAAM